MSSGESWNQMEASSWLSGFSFLFFALCGLCIFRSPYFLFCGAISPFIIPYSDIERLFFKNASINPIVQKLLIGIFISTMFFFVEWFTIFDIRKKWARHKEISSKNELLMIPAYLGFITIIYSVGFYIAMAYVPGLAVYAFLFKELIFEILIAITIILLLICFNRIQKRAKFIRKLKKASSESDSSSSSGILSTKGFFSSFSSFSSL